MDRHPLRRALTNLGVATSHPAAFLIVLLYGLAWAFLDPRGLDWHGVATLATWTMTLFIQRAEHRDTQGIQAKLDELLRSMPEARTEIQSIDNEEPEDIEQHRQLEQPQQPD